MENQTDNTTYELAFHITTSLEEEKVLPEVQTLEQLVTENGGSIIASQSPRRTRLSYPIDHQRHAYFGYIDFTAPSESLEIITKQLKLNAAIIRHMLIKKDVAGPGLSALASHKQEKSTGSRPPRTHIQKTPKKPVEPASPEQEKQIEKELEGVLEKI